MQVSRTQATWSPSNQRASQACPGLQHRSQDLSTILLIRTPDTELRIDGVTFHHVTHSSNPYVIAASSCTSRWLKRNHLPIHIRAHPTAHPDLTNHAIGARKNGFRDTARLTNVQLGRAKPALAACGCTRVGHRRNRPMCVPASAGGGERANKSSARSSKQAGGERSAQDNTGRAHTIVEPAHTPSQSSTCSVTRAFQIVLSILSLLDDGCLHAHRSSLPPNTRSDSARTNGASDTLPRAYPSLNFPEALSCIRIPAPTGG